MAPGTSGAAGPVRGTSNRVRTSMVLPSWSSLTMTMNRKGKRAVGRHTSGKEASRRRQSPGSKSAQVPVPSPKRHFRPRAFISHWLSHNITQVLNTSPHPGPNQGLGFTKSRFTTCITPSALTHLQVCGPATI